MSEEFKISQPGKKDKEQLMKLVKILYEDDPTNQIEKWDRDYSNYLPSTFVAEKNKQIVGYICLGGGEKYVLIGDLCVLPEFRKIGIASKLIKRAIQKAIKQGKDYIRVDTHKDNKNSQSLYKKFGFEIVGETPRGLYILHKKLK